MKTEELIAHTIGAVITTVSFSVAQKYPEIGYPVLAFGLFWLTFRVE